MVKRYQDICKDISILMHEALNDGNIYQNWQRVPRKHVSIREEVNILYCTPHQYSTATASSLLCMIILRALSASFLHRRSLNYVIICNHASPAKVLRYICSNLDMRYCTDSVSMK